MAARVQDVERRKFGDRGDESDVFFGTFVIAHVYSGPAELLGRQFTAPSRNRFPSGNGYPNVPAFQIGETGLWMLRDTPGGDLVPLAGCFIGERGFPVRKGISPRYHDAVCFAESFKKVFNADTRAAKLELLKSFTSSSVPEIATWAVSALGDEARDDSEIEVFLLKLLADDGLTVAAQVALDGALLKALQERWQHSPDRLKLLDRWVHLRVSDEDANRVMRRIDVIGQQPQYQGIGLEHLLALSRTATMNDGFSVKSRHSLLRIIGAWTPVRARRYTDDTPAFEFMRDVVRDSKESELRLSAAAFLHVFLQTDTERRRGIVLELKQSVKDEKLSQALQHSLRPPEPPRPTKLINPDDLP